MSKISKKTICFMAGCLVLAFLSVFLLGSDSTPFLLWWVCVLFIGAAFMPVASKLFSAFTDKGWAFSKALGIAVCGYLMFFLCRVNLLPFTSGSCLVCVLIPAAGSILFGILWKKKTGPSHGESNPNTLDLILLEEMLFLGIFLMWTYFTGFNPRALSTEKFMDYGFMAAMMRDTNLPFVDFWHAKDGINYYYGGQYFAVFLTKLTLTRVNETYNIAKCLVAAFAFVLPVSLVYELYINRKGKKEKRFGIGAMCGIIAGTAVSLAGNVHYILYGLFGNILKLSGYETYWFPSSTRYIGHNPETADNCIHEFPSYSFVLGDLHAHVVNLIFVLLLLGLLYLWLKKREEDRISEFCEGCTTADLLKEVFADPLLYLIGFLIGLFQFVNYWDFAIYIVVFAISALLAAIRQNRHHPIEAAMQFVLRVLIVFILSTLFAAPFTVSFKTMQSGIGLAVYHSAFYQLVILWGLPVVCVLSLFIFTLFLCKKKVTDHPAPDGSCALKRFIGGLTHSDLFVLILGFCAIGLILAPEVIYVKDIYGGGMSRANTMFKFTYQGYLMFGISMIYALFRLLGDSKKLFTKIISCILLFVFILTCAYFPYAVKCWFGKVTDRDGYQGLNATAYLKYEMADDADAIFWLEKNISGTPVVLETNGNSYTHNCRVSAMTGLPTVMGWYTHEWLWRDDTEELNVRVAEISEIYTSADRERVSYLLDKYNVDYIFVGSCERDAYEDLNEGMLLSFGKVVYRGVSGENPAYIIEIDRSAE